MIAKSSILPLLLLLALMFGGIRIFFPSLLHSPATTLASSSGDGLKNYATAIYHIRYDSCAHHFQGMLYPYGDHVVFSDNQPILSNTLRWLEDRGFAVADRTIGIFNLAMLLSLLLSALLLFGIWRRLEVPPWIAAVAAAGVSFLSPQLLRFEGHYGLAHSFVLPALLYLMLQYEERPGLMTSLKIAAIVLISSQLHFYFFGITSFLLLAWFLVRTIRKPSRKRLFFDLRHLLIQWILPLGFLMFWLYGHGQWPERPANPYGFLEYRAHWEGLLLPYDLPLGEWISENWISVRQVGIEGYAYIGWLAILGLVGIGIGKLFKLRFSSSANRVHCRFLFHSGCAAFLLLLLSLGLPFIIPPLENLLPYTGPLRQFRGIGRFAWPFFYVVNICSVYFWYQLARSRPSRLFGIVAVLLLTGILASDVWQVRMAHPLHSRSLQNLKQQLGLQEAAWLKYINPSDYQAILPIPFFHIGSENFWIEPKGQILEKTLIASLQSGLPTLAALMTRSPLDRSRKALQLALPHETMPSILNDLPSSKPLLLLVDKSLPSQQQAAHLLENARFLYENEAVQFFSFALDDIPKGLAKREQQVRALAHKRAVYPKQLFYSTDSAASLMMGGFVHLQKGDRPISSPLSASAGDTLSLFRGPFDGLSASPQLLSFWYRIRHDLSPLAQLQVELGGQQQRYAIQNYIKRIDHDWCLVEVPLQLDTAEGKLHIYLTSHPFARFDMTVGERLIRITTDSLFADFGNAYFFNNRWFGRKHTVE